MKKQKIMIVDDVPQNIQLAAGILKSEDREIVFTRDSLSALEMAEQEQPDLILLDVMMPDLDGYEICRRLKQTESTREIPVIFITAKTDSEGVIEGFAAGSADYIVKPFRAKELIARVQTHLTLRQTQKDLKIYAEGLSLLNKKLKASNENLDHFASLVAHDLNEPLTTLTGFLEIFASEYLELLPEQGREFLLQMQKSSERMARMISDLLDYSRLSSSKQDFALTDFRELLSQAMANLQSLIEREKAKITFTALPELPANRAQMVRLFQNLLGNAIKYRGKKSPEIQVSATESESEWIFAVKDNGIGIDKKFYTKIFKIFQRLHESEEEYQGTGIGLAACQKIVENHQGRIWVESEVGQGSVFYFTLPKIHVSPV